MRLTPALLTLSLPVALAIAGPAMAKDPIPAPMTYEMFELAVPHVDLAACPAPLAAEGRFCRLTTNNEALNVFAFSEEGDQPMVAFQSWSAELLDGLMD